MELESKQVSVNSETPLIWANGLNRERISSRRFDSAAKTDFAIDCASLALGFLTVLASGSETSIGASSVTSSDSSRISS